MSMFGAISTAHSGLQVHRTWLDGSEFRWRDTASAATH